MKYEKEIKQLLEMAVWGENEIHLALALAYWQVTAAGDAATARALLVRLSGLDNETAVRLRSPEFRMLFALVKLGQCELNDALKRVFFPRPIGFFDACTFYESEGESVAPLVDSIWEHIKSLPTPDRTIVRSLRLTYARSAVKIGNMAKARRLLSEVIENSGPVCPDFEEYKLHLEIAELHFLLGEKETCRRLLRQALEAIEKETDDVKAMRLFGRLYRYILDFSENDEALLRDYVDCARNDKARLSAVELLMDKELPLWVPEILERMEERNWRETARLHLALYFVAKNDFAEAEAARPREKFQLPCGEEAGFYAGPLGRDEFYLDKDRRLAIMSWLDMIGQEDDGIDIQIEVCDQVCDALTTAGLMEEAETVRGRFRKARNLMHNLIISAIAARNAGREVDARQLMKRLKKIQAKPRSSRSLRSKYIWGLFRFGEIETASRLLRRDPTVIKKDSFEGLNIVNFLIQKNDLKKVREFCCFLTSKDLIFKFEMAAGPLFHAKKYKDAVELWLQGLLISQGIGRGEKR